MELKDLTRSNILLWVTTRERDSKGNPYYVHLNYQKGQTTHASPC
jgi:hypothetical protein